MRLDGLEDIEEYLLDGAWVFPPGDKLKTAARGGYDVLQICRDATIQDLRRVMNSHNAVTRLVREIRLPEGPAPLPELQVLFKRVIAVIAVDANRRLERQRVRDQVRKRVRTAPAPRHGRERHWERQHGR